MASRPLFCAVPGVTFGINRRKAPIKCLWYNMFDWALLVLFALNVTWLKCLVFKTFWCPVYKLCASTNCIKIQVFRFTASVDYMWQYNKTRDHTDFEKISIFWDPLWHLEWHSFQHGRPSKTTFELGRFLKNFYQVLHCANIKST